MEISLVNLDSLEYWVRWLSPDGAAALVDQNILPADVQYVSEGDIDLFSLC